MITDYMKFKNKLSMNKWISKCGIYEYYSATKKGTPATRDNLDRPRGHHAK